VGGSPTCRDTTQGDGSVFSNLALWTLYQAALREAACAGARAADSLNGVGHFRPRHQPHPHVTSTTTVPELRPKSLALTSPS
jgi:hypothetical protein